MKMYTFYLCQEDRSARAFEAFELRHKTDAERRAGKLLIEHRTCAYVSVWESDRQILTVQRRRQPSGPTEQQNRPRARAFRPALA